MLKFWKKKPAAEPESPDKPAESGPDDDSDSTGRITEEQPALRPPFTEIPIDLAITDQQPVDPRLLAAAEPEAGKPEPAAKTWRDRLSGSGFSKGLGGLFARNPKLDENLLDELETCLISADVGITASTEMVEELRGRVAKREFADADALLGALRKRLVELLKPVEKPLDVSGHKPFVLLMVGVNGVGKTTTIGKIARRLLHQQHEIMLAAGDTFRAAAVEQLQTWGQRNGVHVISQGSGADSASVIFDALQAARSRKVDVLIADTAGRLHTQSGLMDELGKIRRVLAKIDPEAPHEVLMVIDGTTGQNAIAQLKHFREAIGVTGLVVTKLDGTAKGGVVFALAREFNLPIRFLGLGEGAEDLRVFNAQAFVDGLLPASLAKTDH
ncbi:signal recognition particle-docking protein FtsY [Dokdonella sp.]|uniref:signal recognition particle-docking protein FtsY n=1 Tax=Dokdonella sp. TaxID=2291710 RepID=UPI0035271CF4